MVDESIISILNKNEINNLLYNNEFQYNSMKSPLFYQNYNISTTPMKEVKILI